MNAVETRTSAPAVTICNGIATVLTTNVSAVFEKDHRKVVRDVEDIIQRTPEDRRGNFIPVELERPSNLGKGIVKYKAYALTKAGFTFLAMGFTGVKADKFKWAYIDEFDRMEEEIGKSFVSRLPCMKDYLKAYAIYEQGKAIASQAGKTLSQWGRIKQPTEAQLRIMEDQIQLSIKFEPAS